MMAYFKRFWTEAKNKVTVWWLAFSGVFNIATDFDSIAGILPKTVVAHKTAIVSTMFAVGIWTRVRRALKTPPTPPAA